MRLTERRITERAMFLQAAYTAANGRSLNDFEYTTIGQSLGLNDTDTEMLATELMRRGYLEGLTFQGGSAYLTEAGLDVVERIETLDTPPPRIEDLGINIGNVSNSVVNINTKNVNSQQAVKEAQDKWWSSLGPIATGVVQALFSVV